MKKRFKLINGAAHEQLIATFGDARLVRMADGSTELRGGRAHDQTTAKEWVSLFMHEAVLKLPIPARN